ncbi:hypothetical protein CUMW_140430 [Citrus unshiu]|uniref:Uncharacterized protein n=1 Tax=Citrus unshiu TaxID=55188 RepID=A0A2H5PIS4_CITUN|nr:hypothetical protein CUMW_140430 [Citrus unshiu]
MLAMLHLIRFSTSSESNSELAWFVKTGGIKGDLGPQTTINWFRIEKFYGDYKLVFCPSVCKFCKVLCIDVGIFVNGGVWHLALSDVTFNVTFLKG